MREGGDVGTQTVLGLLERFKGRFINMCLIIINLYVDDTVL